MYDVQLWLIRKRVVDFLLVLIELFSLGVTAEALRANICSKSAISLQRGPVDQNFSQKRSPPSNILLFRKLGYVMCGLDTTFFRFVTNYAFDRQTDGDTARILIASKNETRYAVLPATLRWRSSIVIS